LQINGYLESVKGVRVLAEVKTKGVRSPKSLFWILINDRSENRKEYQLKLRVVFTLFEDWVGDCF